MPAIWFWKPDDFYYHSVHDTVDKLDGNSLKAVARPHRDHALAASERGRAAALRPDGRGQEALMAADEVNHERLIQLRQEGALRVCE